jgi:hypothetical protein
MFKDSRSDQEAFDVPFCESCFSYRTSAQEGKLGLEEERPDLLRNAIESKDGPIYVSRREFIRSSLKHLKLSCEGRVVALRYHRPKCHTFG